MAYTTQFGYDNRGYLTHVTDPDAGVTYYTHDALGRMTSPDQAAPGQWLRDLL